jgi:hypothetical protein
MTLRIRTLELAAWDFDYYEFRPEAFDRNKLVKARGLVGQRQSFRDASALRVDETILLRDTLERQLSRSDLQAEMHGLDWYLGMVDLRCLLAFQRRLSFNPTLPSMPVPRQDDWESLMDIAFAPPNPVSCDIVHNADSNSVILRSNNPNLHLRVSQDPSELIVVHAGSPFVEVACYANRWFLRDGYHRAYTLLCSGISLLPAVIVNAKSLEELGAVKTRFFSEAILLADHPPFVTDFLDDALTIEYDRPPTIKTLRLTIEEIITTAISTEISGEQA